MTINPGVLLCAHLDGPGCADECTLGAGEQGDCPSLVHFGGVAREGRLSTIRRVEIIEELSQFSDL